MRPTVETIARAALGDLAVDQEGLLNAKRWVNDRYAEFAGQARLKALRRLGELTLPAVVTAGTVTVTSGSTTVTGNATAVAAWTVDLIGRALQVAANVWYRIADVSLSASTLTLGEPYAGDSGRAQTYRIVAQSLILPEDVRSVLGFYHDRYNRELRLRSLTWMNLHTAERFYLLGGPQIAVDLGADASTGQRRFEFYPYSDDLEHLRYAYYAVPPRLDFDDALPGSVDQDALKEGVLIDVMRWRMAREADKNNYDGAAFWRNEYRAQETKWQGVLQRLSRADAAIDDLHWTTLSAQGRWTGDITTARDQIVAAGQRP